MGFIFPQYHVTNTFVRLSHHSIGFSVAGTKGRGNDVQSPSQLVVQSLTCGIVGPLSSNGGATI